MYDLLKAKNAALAGETLEFAAELVRTPSPSYQEAGVADLVERKMKEMGYDRVLRDESGNVVGLLYGREAEPALLLNAHMDTAAPGPQSGWNEAACSGRRAGGVLHGLGASDCKGGLAAQVFAGALLKRALLPLRGTLVVAATVAEEAGGSSGVRALVAKTLPELEVKPMGAILADPTDLGLYYGHDGWIEMDVRIDGANPFQVHDAAGLVRGGFTARNRLAGASGPQEFQSVLPPVFEERTGSRCAVLRVVRRLLPSEHESDVLDEMTQSVSTLAHSAGPVAVEVTVRKEQQRLYTGRMTTVRHVTHAWASDPFHPLMERSRQALAAAGCGVRPGKWTLGRLGMGTAGSALIHEFAVPTIGYGPGDETKCHAPNESVSEAQIVEATYATAAIAHAMVGVPVCGWTSDEI